MRSAPGRPEDAALAAWLALPRGARARDVLMDAACGATVSAADALCRIPAAPAG